MRTRTALGAVLGALTLAGLAACGGTNPEPAPPASPAPPAAASPAGASPAASPQHNAADVTFVQGMIPHHSQAVTMSEQARTRATSAEVKDLAARIAQAQGPEIAQMRGFLAAWGVPETAPGAMPGMDHGGMSGMGGSGGMSGMMSDQQMQQLGQAQGPAFDRMFLQMMIEHHKGAVEMARTELAQGQNTEAKTLASKITADQQAEISEMQALLRKG